MRPRGLPARRVKVLPWYYTDRKTPSRQAEQAAALELENEATGHPDSGAASGEDGR